MYDNYGKYNHLSTILPDTFSIPSSDSDVSSPAMAQQAPDRNSAFQFGIIPPLSSNGLKMREFTNGVSVNMLLGISKNERYLTVSGAGSIVSGQADGLQLFRAVQLDRRRLRPDGFQLLQCHKGDFHGPADSRSGECSGQSQRSAASATRCRCLSRTLRQGLSAMSSRQASRCWWRTPSSTTSTPGHPR